MILNARLCCIRPRAEDNTAFIQTIAAEDSSAVFRHDTSEAGVGECHTLAESNYMVSVQIFGVKSSQATRAAERFFKERSAQIHMVDLIQKPMSPGEIRRFIERFGLAGLLDTEGKAYVDAGLKYYKLSDAEVLGKIEKDPKLLRLPFVRAANKLSIGQDEVAWKAMFTAGDAKPLKPGPGPRK